jgi:hypothetical protein
VWIPNVLENATTWFWTATRRGAGRRAGGAGRHDARLGVLAELVDTSALLSGNIGFKRDSINSAGGGLNKAFEAMKSANFRIHQDSVAGCPPPAATGTACTAAGEWAKLNFYPRILETDENGFP